jgi:hypothetical protein
VILLTIVGEVFTLYDLYLMKHGEAAEFLVYLTLKPGAFASVLSVGFGLVSPRGYICKKTQPVFNFNPHRRESMFLL